MKDNPLIYILVIGIVVVVLLIFLVNSESDHALVSQSPLPSPTTPPSYLSEDGDNPSEAVKAVGSQINQLREDQSAFKQSINQTVEQIHRELQTLHKEIRKLASRQDAVKRDLPAEGQVQNLNPSTSGAEPIAPYYEEIPDTPSADLNINHHPSPHPIIQTQPSWLWIEDQSVLTPASIMNTDSPPEHPLNELSEYLGVDTLAVSEYGGSNAASLIIPPSTVIQGLTLTAAIGRLPVRGQLNEPWPVKVISAAEGYAPNGYAVDAAQMIWDGKAFGDANFECVRVVLTRVTTVLPGAVVAFVEAADAEEGLGYLSDARGHPCLKGKLVSNAAKQLTAEAILGIAQGVGKGYADTQRTRTVSPEGNTIESITGEEVRVLIGEGFANSVNNVRNYLASRYDVWDAVYVAPEQEVIINVDQPLEFIYDKDQKLYDVSHFAFKIGADDSARLD